MQSDECINGPGFAFALISVHSRAKIISVASRKKILLQTNAPWLKSGLGENGRYLMKHLLRTGKYDLTYYCTNGILSNDPNLGRMPCKAYGVIPADQNVINQLNAHQEQLRHASYGAMLVDEVIKEVKPDIWWESDDLWSTNGYLDKPWFKHVHAVFHKTPDSRPILDVAFQQARATPHYTVWSEFAAKEMKKRDPKLAHVRHIYGMFDTAHFSPLTPAEKLDLRKRFGLDPKALIFHTTNRNQLRKCFVQTIEAFAKFKRDNPRIKAHLHFHTAFNEKAMGWDIAGQAKFHGLAPADILTTYICRACGNWHIAPYAGDEVNCPHCGTEKGMITPNINLGIPDDEMRLMHGVCDAGLSIFDSGGLERFSVSSLMCGLPTAISAYSCGEDFMHLPFVHAVEWEPFYQPGSSFMKATPKVASLVKFMERVAALSSADRQALAEQGRDWAVRTFSVETIGRQWEDLFDALPPKDWSSVTPEQLKPVMKNEEFPLPDVLDAEQFIKTLYNKILLVEPDPEGMKNWLAQINQGASRRAIYDFFIGRARAENAPHRPPPDFAKLFDDNQRKRVLLVMKESGGDVFICTALFRGLKAVYPDADLYVATERKFHDILALNPHVHKVLEYHPGMNHELLMKQHVDYFYYPGVATQALLNYLTHEQLGVELDYDKTLLGGGRAMAFNSKQDAELSSLR